MPILAAQQRVGIPIPDKPLPFGVNAERHADCQATRLEVNAIANEMLLHSIESLRRNGVAGHSGANLLGIGSLAQTVGDVAQMAQSAGKVAPENVRVQVLDAAAPHCLDEVREVVFLSKALARELLDQLALTVIGTVAGDVAALALNDVSDRPARIALHRLGA